MAFEISIGQNKQRRHTVKKIEDEILAIAYVFNLLAEKHIPQENIFIYNTITDKLETLHEWTGTPEGESVI